MNVKITLKDSELMNDPEVAAYVRELERKLMETVTTPQMLADLETMLCITGQAVVQTRLLEDDRLESQVVL